MAVQKVLLADIADEMRAFVGDVTLEVVATRLGISYREAVYRFIQPEHVETSAAWLRKVATNMPGRLRETQSNRIGDTSPVGGKKLFEFRAQSLCGRPTFRGASAAVRRQQLLLSEDEVILATAVELSMAGYTVLAIAGQEILLELPQPHATAERMSEVAKLARDRAQQILSPVPPRVEYGVAESW